MPMLGEILAAARQSSAGFDAWLAARDQALSEAVAAAAQEDGQTVTGFVRAAVADFARFASEEDWVQLTSRLRQTDDPGMVCLGTMVEWRLVLAAAHASHIQDGEG